MRGGAPFLENAMAPVLDILPGQWFGRWQTVEEQPPNKLRQIMWLCKCTCGVQRKVPATRLRRGRSLGCGCLKRELLLKRNRTHGHASGKRKSKVYIAWRDMLTRCLNPKFIGWQHYGGRGIQICLRWQTSFENFLADVGTPPNKKYSLDRINPNGDYKPQNVRWATRSEQVRNRRPYKRRCS